MAARLRPLIPDVAFRAGWSGSAFLIYAGAFVALASTLWLLEALNGEGDDFGLVAWSALALAVLAGAAWLLSWKGREIPAGLAAFSAVIVFAVWVGAIEDLVGLLPEEEEDDFVSRHFEFGILVLEVLTAAAALVALRLFRFPLLVLPLAVVVWYGVLDHTNLLLGGLGNTGQALLAVVVGLLLAAAAVAVDTSDRRAYGFWLHLVAGLSVGGGVISLVNEKTWHWLVVGAISLLFVGAAWYLDRSSYAVLGAVGVFLTSSYFIDKWFGVEEPIAFLLGSEPGDGPDWAGPLAYVVVGLILVSLGMLVARSRRARPEI